MQERRLAQHGSSRKPGAVSDRHTPVALDRQTKGHVVIISRQRIIGATNGSSVYLLNLAQAARDAGYTLHLVQPSPNIMGRWPVMRFLPEMAMFESHAIRGVLRCGKWVVSRDPSVYVDACRGIISRCARRMGFRGAKWEDRPRPYSIAAPWTRADHRFVAEHSAIADLVIADYAFQAAALRHFASRPSAIIMHDLFHRRQSQAGGRDSVAAIDEAAEITMLARADAVIAIQSDEVRYVVENIPRAKAVLAPIAVRPVQEPQPGKADRLLFVGSNTAPNVIGLEWLFEDIWPRVKAAAPQLQLDIVGSVAAAFPLSPPAGVVFHGLVTDLTPFYADAGIVVSALTFGSGLKIKLIEALAHGKAVVATGVTLQGVEQQCRTSVLRADEPLQFAECILALLDDDRRLRLAKAALDTARTHFSPQASHAEFVRWLNDNRPCHPRSESLSA